MAEWPMSHQKGQMGCLRQNKNNNIKAVFCLYNQSIFVKECRLCLKLNQVESEELDQTLPSASTLQHRVTESVFGKNRSLEGYIYGAKLTLLMYVI